MQSVILLFLAIFLQTVFAPPVNQNKKENGDESEVNGLEDYMEYHRYLREVVNALESDPDFRQKLEKADESDIKSGKIAEQLEFVSHHVRTRLDEIKRVELERLKELMTKKRKLENPNAFDTEDPSHHHLDHANPHTFEIEDLKKLIAKTTADLAEVDKKRKEQFKQYEMEKEYKKQEKLNHTNGVEREQLEKEYKEMEEKHKKHEKLHEPGHKAQLEEVWEEQDQMQQEFNPKTFFMLHDLDGDGLWDQNEVKSLFVKELEKMYEQGHPEDDMREKAEEMERMRESVFNEMDTNQDGFIDYNEFLRQTNTNDFKQDNGWQGLDEQKVFTPEELEDYIRQHHLEQAAAYEQQVPYQGAPGGHQQIPQYQVPQSYQQVPPGAYQQIHNEGYQQVPGGFHGISSHPGDFAQGYQHPVPQGGFQQNQQIPPNQGGYQQNQQMPQATYQQSQHIPPHQGGYQQNQQMPQAEYQQNSQQSVYQQGQVVPAAVLKKSELQNNDLNTNEIYPQGHQQQQTNLKQSMAAMSNQQPINSQPNQQPINIQPVVNQQNQQMPNVQQNLQVPNQQDNQIKHNIPVKST